MNDSFWKHMARVNASLFMMLGFIVLLAVLVWALRPAGDGVMQFGPDAPSGQDGQGTGAAAEIAKVPRVSLNPDDNPFSSEYLNQLIAERRQAERLARQKTMAESNTGQANAGQTPVKGDSAAWGDPQKKTANPSEPPRQIEMIYRGMMTKLDGTRLALIDIPEKGASAYYQTGAEIEWLTIDSFTRAAIEMTAGEKVFSLPRGVLCEIEERGAQ